jgi:hypothetical protein
VAKIGFVFEKDWIGHRPTQTDTDGLGGSLRGGLIGWIGSIGKANQFN